MAIRRIPVKNVTLMEDEGSSQIRAEKVLGSALCLVLVSKIDCPKRQIFPKKSARAVVWFSLRAKFSSSAQDCSVGHIEAKPPPVGRPKTTRPRAKE